MIPPSFDGRLATAATADHKDSASKNLGGVHDSIEEFGHDKLAWLKKFLRLPNGVPSHDTISRVFRQLKPAAFQEGFARWIESLADSYEFRQVAIDGKTLRRSHDRRTMKSALHAVCAWSVNNHLLLGQQRSTPNRTRSLLTAFQSGGAGRSNLVALGG